MSQSKEPATSALWPISSFRCTALAASLSELGGHQHQVNFAAQPGFANDICLAADQHQPRRKQMGAAHLTKSTTEGKTMKGSIIDDTTAIGKRLNELTSKQVAVKTATPPPRRLPVCLRCDDTGWMKDGRNWRTCSACSNPLRKPFPDSSWSS
jgi:hypothetical protein